MEVINIKNVSVQPNVGPAVSMRVISSATQEELKASKAGDILNAKAIEGLLGDVTGVPGPQGAKGDKGDKGDQGIPGATITVINNITSSNPTAALAAAQGKVLSDLIIALTARVNALESKP